MFSGRPLLSAVAFIVLVSYLISIVFPLVLGTVEQILGLTRSRRR